MTPEELLKLAERYERARSIGGYELDYCNEAWDAMAAPREIMPLLRELLLLREIAEELTTDGLSGWGVAGACVSCGEYRPTSPDEEWHLDDCAFVAWRALREAREEGER